MKWYKLLLIIFIIGIVIYALNSSYSDILNNLPESMRSNVEKYDNSNNITIALFHATWCGHCVQYRKAGTFMNTYNSINSDPSMSNIKFIEYEFDNNKNLATKYNINSFPTIVAIDSDGNLLSTFNGDRSSSDELIAFAKKNLNK